MSCRCSIPIAKAIIGDAASWRGIDDAQRGGKKMTRKKPPPWLHPNAEFHMYVGFCIAAWAKVDEQLFALCRKSLGAPKRQAAIVYYKSPTLESRLTLVDELIQSVLPPPARKNGEKKHPDVLTWRELLSAVKQLQANRRLIAHSPVSVRHKIVTLDPKVTGGLSGEIRDVIPTFEIDFSEGERLRGKSESNTPLGVDDLSIHAVSVQSAANALKHYADVVLPPHLK